jgi:hypothetical protein
MQTYYVHYCQLSSAVEKAGCAKLVPVPAADEDKRSEQFEGPALVEAAESG